jgi:hypothetical protein
LSSSTNSANASATGVKNADDSATRTAPRTPDSR